MADDRIFSVEIITPDRIFYQGEAEMIEFTTVNGEIGVYKNHIPLTTVFSAGNCYDYRTGRKERSNNAFRLC